MVSKSTLWGYQSKATRVAGRPTTLAQWRDQAVQLFMRVGSLEKELEIERRRYAALQKRHQASMEEAAQLIREANAESIAATQRAELAEAQRVAHERDAIEEIKRLNQEICVLSDSLGRVA